MGMRAHMQPFAELWFRYEFPSILNQLWWKLLVFFCFVLYIYIYILCAWLQSWSLRSNFVIYELTSVHVNWMMKIRRLDPHSRPLERPKLMRSHGVVLPLNNFSWKLSDSWSYAGLLNMTTPTSWSTYYKLGRISKARTSPTGQHSLALWKEEEQKLPSCCWSLELTSSHVTSLVGPACTSLCNTNDWIHCVCS